MPTFGGGKHAHGLIAKPSKFAYGIKDAKAVHDFLHAMLTCLHMARMECASTFLDGFALTYHRSLTALRPAFTFLWSEFAAGDGHGRLIDIAQNQLEPCANPESAQMLCTRQPNASTRLCSCSKALCAAPEHSSFVWYSPHCCQGRGHHAQRPAPLSAPPCLYCAPSTGP